MLGNNGDASAVYVAVAVAAVVLLCVCKRLLASPRAAFWFSRARSNILRSLVFQKSIFFRAKFVLGLRLFAFVSFGTICAKATCNQTTKRFFMLVAYLRVTCLSRVAHDVDSSVTEV